jgi:hypothetical protein
MTTIVEKSPRCRAYDLGRSGARAWRRQNRFITPSPATFIWTADLARKKSHHVRDANSHFLVSELVQRIRATSRPNS